MEYIIIRKGCNNMEYIIIEARTVKRISKRIRENYMLLPPADTWIL